MIIKPMIKSNIALNAHPKGCHKNILNQIDYVKKQDKINTKPLNVLIIGGSSGYGLATRIALAFAADAFTYNVSLESGPKRRNTGSSGFYNNYYFKEEACRNNIDCFDLNADCFSNETKQEVVDYFIKNNKKIDLVVYSIASPIRIDPDNKIKYSSVIKPINENYEGFTLDLAKMKLKKEIIEAASDEEIENTRKVMGGEDYLLWIKALDKNNLFNENATSVAYTYIGSPCTYPIYKNGTIGNAKRDLEKKNDEINVILNKYHGNSYICSSKSVVTKASVFIPTVTLYASALFMAMKENNTHEEMIEHKYRLYKDMIYGNKMLLDEDGIIRLDSYELDINIQNKVNKLLQEVNEDNFLDYLDIDDIYNQFLNINGFNFEDVDYNEDIDLDIYL